MENNAYSLIKGAVNPLWTISEKLPDFVKIAGVFALFLTVLSYIFGQTYVCVFASETDIALPCLGSSFVYFPYLIIKLLIINIFIIYWLKKVLLNQPFNKNMAAKGVGLFFSSAKACDEVLSLLISLYKAIKASISKSSLV